MNTQAKTSLVQAAALATVWVLASSFAGQTADAKNQTRHPDMAVAQAFETLEAAGQYAPARHETGAAKGDLLVARDACSGLTWPYIPAECVNGSSRKAARTITIEKHSGKAFSELIRVAAEQRVASR